MVWTPRVTVAAVVQREGRFLVIEEMSRDKLVLNQPAGHLEPGESPAQGAIRETLEESAWHFTPTGIVGLYLWTAPETGTTTLRIAFRGDVMGHDPHRPLDEGIVRSLWMTPAELRAAGPRLRSPLVLQCVEDFLAGCNAPLDLIRSTGLGAAGESFPP